MNSIAIGDFVKVTNKPWVPFGCTYIGVVTSTNQWSTLRLRTRSHYGPNYPMIEMIFDCSCNIELLSDGDAMLWKLENE